MVLAQVEGVTASGLSDFAGKFGFPALLVIILLVGLWKLFQAAAVERKEREAECRAERKEDRDTHLTALAQNRDAHLAALGKHTEVITQFGAGLTRLEVKVDNLDRDLTSLKTTKSG